MDLTHLPSEIVLIILSNLSPKDLLTITIICSSWRRFALSQRLFDDLWQKACHNRWNVANLNYELKLRPRSWREIYKAKYFVDMCWLRGESHRTIMEMSEPAWKVVLVNGQEGQKIVGSLWSGEDGRGFISFISPTGTLEYKHSTTGNIISQVVVYRSNSCVICTGDSTGKLSLWSDKGERLRSYSLHTGYIMCVRHLGGDLVVTAGWDKYITVFNISTLQVVSRMKGHNSSIRSLATSPRGGIVSGGHDRVILVWDPKYARQGAEPRERLVGHTGYVLCLEIKKTNKRHNPYGIKMIVSASTDRTCRVWVYTPSGFECKHVLKGHEGQIYTLEFDSKKGSILTGSYDRTVRVWSAYTAQCTHILPHSGVISCMRYDPKRRLLVTATNDITVNFWSLETGKLLHKSRGDHTGYVLSIDLNDDIAVTGGQDGRLVIWNFKDQPSSLFHNPWFLSTVALSAILLVGYCIQWFKIHKKK